MPIRLRRCPDCGSISSDSEYTCGVCGTDLSATGHVSLGEAEQVKEAPFKPESPINRTAVAVSIAGAGMIIAGIVSIYFLGGLGILLLAAGLFLLLVGIDSFRDRPSRPLRVWK